MPQTREHLAIVELLRIPGLVVALTKADLVEEEWMELARDDVADALAGTPYAGSPVVATSAETGAGLDLLRSTLGKAAGRLTRRRTARDVVCLPVDRSFTVRGTGTVVTGTLWSGVLAAGDRVRILPAGVEARIRGLQQHGREVERAGPGTRTAVALAGGDVNPEQVTRGETLVTGRDWPGSTVLTARIRVLPRGDWALERNQRVRLHLGTAEVMARVVLLGRDALLPGEAGWAQLRLEAPLAARGRQPFVLRSYSPVVTFAGGVVAEPHPPKRRARTDPPEALLADVLEGAPEAAVAAALALAGAAGLTQDRLPVATGLPTDAVEAALDRLVRAQGVGPLQAGGRWLAGEEVRGLAERLLAEVDRVHREEAYRPGVPLEALRTRAHRASPAGAADRVLETLVERGALEVAGNLARRPGFNVQLDPARARLLEEVRARYRDAGLEPPFRDDLPREMLDDPAFPHLVQALEARGELVSLQPDLHLWAPILDETVGRVREEFGGRTGLGPADFRSVIPVSRRWLLPILRYLDGQGVTRLEDGVRSVPAD